MKNPKPLDLRKLAQDQTPIDQVKAELEEASKDESIKPWTDEFSASGEKN